MGVINIYIWRERIPRRLCSFSVGISLNLAEEIVALKLVAVALEDGVADLE